MNIKNNLLTLFKELISYDTMSDESSESYPSTEAQFYFAEILAGKLSQIGFTDVDIDKYSYVTATIEANCEGPAIGFISHMDTSPEYSGKGITPIITENYDGSEIKRKGEPLSPSQFPSLKKYIGKTIICSNGTTLLGADDKAGVTEILTFGEYIINHPEIKHGKIRVAFTPDEEIGQGVKYFDADAFGCDFAFTVDGGELGEFSFENFNAASAKLTVKGESVHPGDAKGIMKNACVIASEFISMFPEKEAPAYTEGYEGFYHFLGAEGGVDSAAVNMIIRDFDRENFENRKIFAQECCKRINEKYGNVAHIEIKDQYYNMGDIMKEHIDITNIALDALKKADVKPLVEPIRGGTDGAMLTFKSLPCPNLFTGGHNFHGPYEYICLESMEKAVEVLINIVSI